VPLRVLITAGPTHEPIDAVRYLANRSSGRLGLELARTAADRAWQVTLLLGPSPIAADATSDSRLRVARFLTTADLDSLLRQFQAEADVLILTAAVADFRPSAPAAGKLDRAGGGLRLDLEATPDLAAGCVARRSPGQLIVAFALEAPENLLRRAGEKLRRKGVDLIVANPLSTMDSAEIEGVLMGPEGEIGRTEGPVKKAEFAGWLLDRVQARLGR
jgi:phosphopantothenoylcysteine decarboxylase/phosphopantothenate--cysteine ligase